MERSGAFGKPGWAASVA